jgi:hypothetical protein
VVFAALGTSWVTRWKSLSWTQRAAGFSGQLALDLPTEPAPPAADVLGLHGVEVHPGCCPSSTSMLSKVKARTCASCSSPPGSVPAPGRRAASGSRPGRAGRSSRDQLPCRNRRAVTAAAPPHFCLDLGYFKAHNDGLDEENARGAAVARISRI